MVCLSELINFSVILLYFKIRYSLAHFIPPASITSEEIITQRGYPVEIHKIVTEDGYILTLYRIPCGLEANNEKRKRPAVLLMHGLLASSDFFLISKKSLAYYLSDRGYDVWLGNCRGNQYSRKNVHLDPDYDDEFWNFSWHEMGLYDLPATIDYILNETHQTSLYYVGHSQGTTVFFVMASLRPEFNSKIKLMIAFAPAVFLTHTRQPIFKLISKFPDFFKRVIRGVKVMELLSEDGFGMAAKFICRVGKEICTILVFFISGYDPGQLDMSTTSLMLDTGSGGSSLKQVLHFAQLLFSERFRQYDYGINENFFRYNSTTPPDYNLENVKAPVALFYGNNDNIVTREDVEILNEKLPNVVLKYLVPYEYFSHIDFITAVDADKLVYERVLEEMIKYE